MKLLRLFLIVPACTFFLTAGAEPPAKGLPGEGLAGHWQGSLKPVPFMELRIALEIIKTSAGTFEGAMISMDQGSDRIPISSLTEASGKHTVQVASIGGTFEGQLSADGSEFAGEWRQAGQKFPVVFKRLAKAAALRRPQEPRKPYPYAEEEVTVDHVAAGLKLAGTLTLPPGSGPHPAVLLLTGSGPQDRDESLMGHRPFLVLADHLTRAGFAVLRCDDRGVGRSTGKFGAATVDDFVEDALAGIAWLKSRPEIDGRRIGLLGHSEGGFVAPLAAVKNPESIAFIVLLAGVGIPVEDLLIRQATDLQRVAGASETDMARNTAAQREIFAMLKQAPDAAADVEQRAREIMTRQFAEYTAEQRQTLGLTEAMLTSQSKMVASPWFRKLVTSDPREAFRQVKCPVLAINGEKDLQVSPKENLAGIRDSLAAGGNTRVKIVELPGLNHLFQTCTTGSVSEYGQIEETMAPDALELISSWLWEHARP